MKRLVRFFSLHPILFFILLGAPLNGWCHGTDYSLVKDANLAAIEFHYSDGEPMSYAEVLVFSPQNRQVEHQNARTDKHGKFAFCPDIQGAWLITANDGMGHLCEATVAIGPETSFEKAAKPQGYTDSGHLLQGSKILKIISGLSLILNLAFAAEFFHRWSIAAKR